MNVMNESVQCHQKREKKVQISTTYEDELLILNWRAVCESVGSGRYCWGGSLAGSRDL